MSVRAAAPLILLLALVGLFAVGLTRDPSELPSNLIDRPIPEETLPQLEGTTPLATAEVFSGEPKLLNVFGSWCVACLQEHPLLMELAASDAVPIVGINWRDTDEAAKSWLARHGDPYSTILVDRDSRFVLALGVTGAPETFVVDGAGRIRFKHVGPVTPEVWQTDFLPLVRDLRSGV